MATLNAAQTATVNITTPGAFLTVDCSSGAVVRVSWVGPGSVTGIRTVRNISEDLGPFTDSTVITLTCESGTATYTEIGSQIPPLVLGAGNTYVRWCIPGRDTSGTLFKDVSGRGNDATIDASNTTPFAVDNRMSTVAGATVSGVTQSVSASAGDLATDSLIMAVAMTRADPGANDIVAAWGAQAAAGYPGFYFSHRSSAAGVGRIVGNRGNGGIVSGTDTTVKFSNAGGTRETHLLIAFDAPTGSVYLYRDGVLAAANAGLMTGANAFTQSLMTGQARLGGMSNTATTVAGVFRGWQGYVFSGKGLPINIGRIAALLAESPCTPLRDHEFSF